MRSRRVPWSLSYCGALLRESDNWYLLPTLPSSLMLCNCTCEKLTDNVMAGECVLSEICDSQTYVRTMHKLSVFDPTEVGAARSQGLCFPLKLQSSMI